MRRPRDPSFACVCRLLKAAIRSRDHLGCPRAFYLLSPATRASLSIQRRSAAASSRPKALTGSRRPLKEIAAGRLSRLTRRRQPDERIGAFFRRNQLVGVRREVFLHGVVRAAREPRSHEARMRRMHDDSIRRRALGQRTRKQRCCPTWHCNRPVGDEFIQHLQVARSAGTIVRARGRVDDAHRTRGSTAAAARSSGMTRLVSGSDLNDCRQRSPRCLRA